MVIQTLYTLAYYYFCIKSVDVSFKAALFYTAYYFLETGMNLFALDCIRCFGCIRFCITDTILTVNVTGWHHSMGGKQMLVTLCKLAKEERMLT